MDDAEICTSFKLSQNKKMQISILAELTDTDKETIIEILKDHGLYVRMGKCQGCGKLCRQYINRLCPECEMRKAKLRAQEEARGRCIRYQIQERTQKRQGLIREIGIIDKEIEQLKEELNG